MFYLWPSHSFSHSRLLRKLINNLSMRPSAPKKLKRWLREVKKWLMELRNFPKNLNLGTEKATKDLITPNPRSLQVIILKLRSRMVWWPNWRRASGEKTPKETIQSHVQMGDDHWNRRSGLPHVQILCCQEEKTQTTSATNEATASDANADASPSSDASFSAAKTACSSTDKSICLPYQSATSSNGKTSQSWKTSGKAAICPGKIACSRCERKASWQFDERTSDPEQLCWCSDQVPWKWTQQTENYGQKRRACSIHEKIRACPCYEKRSSSYQHCWKPWILPAIEKKAHPSRPTSLWKRCKLKLCLRISRDLIHHPHRHLKNLELIEYQQSNFKESSFFVEIDISFVGHQKH